MTALIVIGIIALLIAGIMLIRATVYIEYRDEVKLTVAVAGIKIKILPKKEPKAVNINDYSPKKFKKLLKKKEKQERKKLLRQKKKDEKKKAKKLAKKQAKEQKKKGLAEAHEKPKASLLENIALIKDIVAVFFSRFGKRFRIKVVRLNLTVASEDAATTAIMYGAALMGVRGILEILDRVTNLDYAKSSEVNVYVDYLSDKPTADVSLSFGLRVWHLFDILFALARKFLSHLIKRKSKK